MPSTSADSHLSAVLLGRELCCLRNAPLVKSIMHKAEVELRSGRNLKHLATVKFEFITCVSYDIIERKDLGGVMSKDCKDTLQTLKTVSKRECDAK